LGNDFVFADAQDGSGLNNATFGTPPDGLSPGMTMFLWSGPPGERLIVNNGKNLVNYLGVEAQFGSVLTSTPITGNLVIVDDGFGSPDTTDACDIIGNATELGGNIAVIRRGSCEFGFKVLNAQNAGAIGVIVINNNGGPPFSMGPGANGDSVTIPSIMISQVDGEIIANIIEVNPLPVIGELVNDGTGPFNIDGDFDNGIIGHEYGHGISNRLTGGPSAAGCLSNNEQMGEGWSDWFGLMVTMSASDLPSDARGIATFASDQDIDGRGIRPERYSPDFSVNSFTYISTNNENALSVPHGVGFVWATALWDLTWAYIDKYGFDPDLFNGDGGNNRVMKLVIEGLKLQPCSPGFIDGRDAILAADMAITGGESQCLIWEVFSRRGLGFNASQGLTTSRTDQIQDFTTPPSTDISLINCTTLSTDDITSNLVQVYPNPSNGVLNISVAKSFGEVNMTLVDLNGRIVLQISKELNSEVKLNLNQLQSGLYILNIKGDRIDYNTKVVKN
jgi:extracellular elastinolytic metalloproteinase